MEMTMIKLNERIREITMPARLRKLEVSDEGYPVPAFVEWIDGKPDFRVMNSRHFKRCIEQKRCWLCGEPLGKFLAFVIGPMCAVNRVSSEPPSHYDCAAYSVRACPFLSQPRMRRNEKDLPDAGKMAGIAITRNPGVTLIWVTDGYKTFQANGVLFQIGEPLRLEFYREGRRATREEIGVSIETGLPTLRNVAKQQGKYAEEALNVQIQEAWKLINATVGARA
jgi:hypothetical protein